MKKVVVVVAGLSAVGLLALWKVGPLIEPVEDEPPATAPAPATTPVLNATTPTESAVQAGDKTVHAEQQRVIAAVREQIEQGATLKQEPGSVQAPTVQQPPALPEGVTPREDLALAESPDDPANVTPQESKVLAMYEELVARIDRPELACKRFEADFIETVTNHEPALKALHDAQAALPEQEREAARARLELAAGQQLARLRQSLRVGFAKCPPSESMKTELAKLAANNAM
jgi:hypothetical protein